MTTREGETMNADISETISRIARDGARPYQIRGVIMRLRGLLQDMRLNYYAPAGGPDAYIRRLESEIAALEDV